MHPASATISNAALDRSPARELPRDIQKSTNKTRNRSSDVAAVDRNCRISASFQRAAPMLNRGKAMKVRPVSPGRGGGRDFRGGEGSRGRRNDLQADIDLISNR